ncbi:plasmid recombination protein, partial [Clostridioides difficile]|uniref:plasmid recombination protein n=1 Tax=Clostridioides difficile TaxID=1496 RepID=UPI001F1A3AC0
MGNAVERGNVNHRTPDIDAERKHMNMSFKATEHGFYAEWNRIKTELNAQVKETKNGIPCQGLLLTAEAQFFEEPFWCVQGEPMSPALVEYWRECYDWAGKDFRYPC